MEHNLLLLHLRTLPEAAKAGYSFRCLYIVSGSSSRAAAVLCFHHLFLDYFFFCAKARRLLQKGALESGR